MPVSTNVRFYVCASVCLHYCSWMVTCIMLDRIGLINLASDF
jgi:hypothetical protein